MANEKITNPNIIDLDLSAIKKKQFRINGDDNKILELNTADMGIISRIQEVSPKFEKLVEKALGVSEDFNTESEDMDKITDTLKEVDKEMRDLVDYIFDANVCEVVADDGSMYDVFNGSFRFEYIIEVLLNQYEINLKAETDIMKKKFEKHTAKYSKGKK